MLTPQEALVYTMVVVAGSDMDVSEPEIELIGDLVDHLPALREIGRAEAVQMALACSELIAQPGGLDEAFAEIRDALSPALRETAYALARDVIAADRRLQANEVRVLEDVRVHLQVDPAVADAIDRTARARSQAA